MMKKGFFFHIIFPILLVLIINPLFARGKEDIDVPAEDVEYALSAKDVEETKALEPKYKLKKPSGRPLPLRENWGYVMAGREDEYSSEIPLTDVCYFGAEIGTYGSLVNVPARSKLKTGHSRCHLVVVCDSRSLTHFILEPDYNLRNQLLKDIVKAAAPYDGVQIDFELVPVRDRKNFITFLGDLRYMLGKNKWFSVCVPARFRLLSEDVYPYEEIARYCDRVFVMAYDEHWSGSKPGAIANVEWCKKVAEYAKKTIPERKLIMGLPLYGRTWASETTAGAWYFSGANRIMTEHGVEEVEYEDEIPTFKYTAQVEVTGYFNDISSVLAIGRAYQEMGIQKMGFWRIGMEDPELWNWVKINR
ncbi:MAG: glycoside hydrolase [Treponema sp.]|nr:glycoside hydrolase [Treponema sp.]